MKVLLQRVSRASVRIAGEETASIESGLLLLVGFGRNDREQDLVPMATKVVNLRLFPDASGRFDQSLLDVGGSVLLVPQFTLYADTDRGRRPDFTSAMDPARASRLFDAFVKAVFRTGVKRLETGTFGAHMQIESVNDGPVTIMITGREKMTRERNQVPA